MHVEIQRRDTGQIIAKHGARKLLLAVGVGDAVEMLALIPGNVEPAHNTKDTLPQLNSEGVNPTGFADHKG